MAVPGRLLLTALSTLTALAARVLRALRHSRALRRRLARLPAVMALGLVALAAAACLSPSPSGGGSPAPQGTGAQANPIACIPATSAGTFPSPPPGTLVTIDQIARAVGYPVRDAELDAPSTTIFGGFESCQYTFTVSGLTRTENVTIVEGTNPLDGKSSTDEFADTERLEVPLSDRNCTANSCSFHFLTFAGLGEAAVKGASSEGEVIATRQGSVYLEVGPGDLNQTAMVNLAEMILGTVP